MKARSFDYFNTKTMEMKYGIQVKHQGKWMPCAEEGKPLMFDTPEQRDERMREVDRLIATADCEGEG